MRKGFLNLLSLVFATGLMFSFYSCQSDDVENSIIEKEEEDLKPVITFGQQELVRIDKQLKTDHVVVNMPGDEDETVVHKVDSANYAIDIYKITSETNHPDGSGRKIDVSGTLFVPKGLFPQTHTYRIAVIAPGTYTSNEDAPSNLFSADFEEIMTSAMTNIYLRWTSLVKLGHLVLILDYPGFGDSHHQCEHPYMNPNAIALSSIDLIKSTKTRLEELKIEHHKDVSLAGYSQGGHSVLAIARELETNSNHGFGVKVAVSGGAPSNIKKYADRERTELDILASRYITAKILWGYKCNTYPNLDLSKVLKNPYYTDEFLKDIFDGIKTSGAIEEKLPIRASTLFTQGYIKGLDSDPVLVDVKNVLESSNIKPWSNKCLLVLTHGRNDHLISPNQSKDFVTEQEVLGTNVQLDIPTLFRDRWGTHSSHMIYHLNTSLTLLSENR